MPRPSFPRTLREFQRQFADDDACQRYLVACRWPEGFRCPRCGHDRAFPLTAQRRWQCASCQYQVSVTAGTILHNTKQPLVVWFWAAYLITTDKRGFSALLLQRQLGLGRYETAWMMLHKLRRAMVNPSRRLLSGEVEVDEAWIGGPQAGLRGSRQLKGRRAALIVAAIERREKASGRLRLEVIPDFTGATMLAFARRNIAEGATIFTDEMTGFLALGKAGYRHVPRKQPHPTDLRRGQPSVVPLADRAIGNLQQWLIGTHHGVSRGQLQAYLDEFVFRHNRRRQPMAAFQTLLGLGSAIAPSPYAAIRGAADVRKRRHAGSPDLGVT